MRTRVWDIQYGIRGHKYALVAYSKFPIIFTIFLFRLRKLVLTGVEKNTQNAVLRLVTIPLKSSVQQHKFYQHRWTRKTPPDSKDSRGSHVENHQISQAYFQIKTSYIHLKIISVVNQSKLKIFHRWVVIVIPIKVFCRYRHPCTEGLDDEVRLSRSNASVWQSGFCRVPKITIHGICHSKRIQEKSFKVDIPYLL